MAEAATLNSPALRPGDDIAGPATVYTDRARYFNPDTAFDISYPPVPPHTFVAERDAALDPATPTGLIALDLGAAMDLPFAATTPLVLAAYGRIRAGERLRHEPCASTALFYVIEGEGRSRCGEDRIAWSAGDVFCLPGGQPIDHTSLNGDSVLWLVTNEPQLAIEGFAPPAGDAALVEAVHFPAMRIERELERAMVRLAGTKAAGLAVIFASAGLEARRNISPSLTIAMNQLGPGSVQEAHSHNSVAVSIAVDWRDCYSVIDGERKDWQRFATSVTPPGSVHSHHNDGDANAKWLIVQDGGFHYHARTMGFRYEE